MAEGQKAVTNLDFSIEEDRAHPAVIKVVGVGGAGGNAVNHMIEKQIKGVECICINTDQQALNNSLADQKITLGTSGLGAGSKPEVGRKAAEEAREKIRTALQGADMVFITTGMGGGTGTGASPVIAEIARELDILTVGVVTKPFDFEGTKRLRIAEEGISELSKQVNALIVVLNDKLEEFVGEDASHADCLKAADGILYNACAGIAEIINIEGNINVDFEDVRTIMEFQGQAMMGTATASGDNRAEQAANEAIACPLLEGLDLNGAQGLVINITASPNVGQKEIRKINSIITEYASNDAIVKQGVAYDESMGEDIRVTVVASGLGRKQPEVVVDNTDKAQQQRTGTDNLTVDGRSPAAFNPFQRPRAAAGGNRLNTSFGIGSAATESSQESPALERTKVKGSDRDNLDIPAFLRKQAN